MIVFLANNIGDYDYRPDVYNPIDKYINHLKVALYSLSRHCCEPVTVILIDCPSKIGYDLKKLYHNLTIKHFESSAKDQINKRNYKENPLRFIMMREKILAINNIISNTYNKWVLFLDCDIIVLGSLDPLTKSLKPNEPILKIMCRLQLDDAHKFNTGVIGLHNTPAIREMVNRWCEEALKIDELSCEQWGLYKAYEKYKDNIMLCPIEKQYHGWNYDENLIIYHSKGKYRDRLSWMGNFFPLLWEAQERIIG